jgi:hypothetical protein
VLRFRVVRRATRGVGVDVEDAAMGEAGEAVDELAEA